MKETCYTQLTNGHSEVRQQGRTGTRRAHTLQEDDAATEPPPQGTTKPRLKVLLADDHPVVRLGIRAVLEQLPEIELIEEEATDGREAVEMVKKHRPDIVFMDISMPGLRGIEATSRITKEFPATKVIILSRWETEEYYWGALRAGASGYLLKNKATTELAKAIQRVVKDGEIYLAEDIARRLRKKFPLQQIAFVKSPLEDLPERQREVLQLIAEGQTTKAIADILRISAKTVEYHRAKLMERLHIHDIPNLVRFALRHGLISQES